MKKRKEFNIERKIFLFGILSLFLLNFISAANIGISPASISFEDVLRGGYSERTVIISADSEEPIDVVLKPRGEIAEWLNFSESEFSVSKNKPYLLKISVLPPSDIPNGNYEGFLRVEVRGSTKSIEEHAVGTIKSILDMAINVGITDVEIVKCTASDLGISSAEQGDEIILKMNVLNEGNVRLKLNVELEVWDSDKINVLSTEDFLGDEILPSIEQELEFRFDSDDFEAGQYWSDAYIAECYYSETLTFDVLEPGALSAKGILLNILTQGQINVGETSRIISNFKNTGEKEVSAQFKGQVTREGKIVDVLESEISKVPVGEVEEFNFYFTPKNEGKYIISGRVFYEGKKTFEISSALEAVGGNLPLVWVVYVAFVFVIGFLFYRIRKEKRIYLNKLNKLR